MPLFRVKAGNTDGKIIHREIEAGTIAELEAKLEGEGLFPIEVNGTGGLSALGAFKFKRSVGSNDFVAFNQGFATLLKAGVSILDSLETLKAGCKDIALSRVGWVSEA